MSLKAFTIVLGMVWLGIGTAIGQITQRPLVEEQYARYVRITRVELTSRYTIIDMEYRSSYPADLYRLFPNRRLVTNYISIDPRSRLYKPGNTTQKFNFIRAEGIAVEPEQQVVYPGDVVNFRLYYERLDPGIEVFDFFEGRNPGQVEYWNFYGVHINNPLRRSAPAQKAPPREEPRDEPPLASTPQPREAKPEPEPRTGTAALITLRGTVYDASTRRAIPAQLSYADGTDTLRLGTSSGNYRMSLAPEQRYTLSVSARGYLGTSTTVSPADSAGSAALTRDFYLTPLKEGTSITLNNIYFETSKYELLRESYEELDRLVDMMRSTPSLQVRVEGHTDNVGDFDKNLELSRQRASAVRDYLISKGIAPNRVEAKGYGSTRPVAKGASEQERQRNRRVELVILKI